MSNLETAPAEVACSASQSPGASVAARGHAVHRRAGDVVEPRRTQPDDIVSYRQLWEDGDDRFGAVQGYQGAPTRLPAPSLPATRLRPRPFPQEIRRHR